MKSQLDEARALLGELLHKYRNGCSWDPADWDRVRAFLSRPAEEAPDMVLVPREPTDEMLRAGWNAYLEDMKGGLPRFAITYRAMLAAAQEPSHHNDMSAISESGSKNRAEPAPAALSQAEQYAMNCEGYEYDLVPATPVPAAPVRQELTMEKRLMEKRLIELMCEDAIGLNSVRWNRVNAERLRDSALRGLERPSEEAVKLARRHLIEPAGWDLLGFEEVSVLAREVLLLNGEKP